MKRGAISALILILLFLPVVSSVSSIDSQIKKITGYAEDFESGNINYAKLLVYSSEVREEINRNLGTTNKEMGGILKEEQLKSILGEPTEKTKWIWVENEEREIKLDKEASAWRKIIFDGKKVQIWINSWPSIFKKSEEDILIYRLNFEINFKEPQGELNIGDKISNIKKLAETFNADSSKENAEILAKESVNTEKIFERYMRQSSEKCEDAMKNIFGVENRRESQKMLVQEITFYEGKNFDITARIEMCDECEWRWVNLNMWVNGRGAGFKMPKEQAREFSPEEFQNLGPNEYKEKIKETLDEAKSNLEQGNYEIIPSLNSKMQAINEAWNRKSNNIWPEVEKMFKSFEEMNHGQQSKLEEYWWIKQEQQKREKVNEISAKNYQERKEFYLNLFSGYEKKEFYFSQIEYEKRLVEEFREFGKELCDNNLDDNKNEKIDCSDEQCSGKKCGMQKVLVQKGNETIEDERELFCIEGSCQLMEEVISKEEKSICGNHICEKDEGQYCRQDCTLCQDYNAIECSGKVIFKGTDENNCPLEPICLSETNYCEKSEDCTQSLCGKSECISNECKITGLEECREAECSDGEEKINNCDNGEKIITEICQEKLWKKTGAECEVPKENNLISEMPFLDEDSDSGNECQVKEDCGNENDVCSNGKCVTLPEIIVKEHPEQPPAGQATIKETEQNLAIGSFIPFIEPIKNKFTGFSIEEEAGQATGEQNIQEEIKNEQEQREMQEREDREKEWQEEKERREREDKERRANECSNNCNRECKDKLISSCVGECVRNSQCKEASCIDEEIKKCEAECKEEKGFDKCVVGCTEECKIGKHLEIEEQREEHKEEKGVFKAGGTCRISQGNQKTESFIFFDGWGEPFEQIQPLKQKYYSGGDNEWCKRELENLLKQRKEIEKGLNQDFAVWFFEKYLPNSADEWEQHISGIFELYWKDVDLSRQIVERMNCLDINKSLQYNLINITYETSYGKLELWEEIKTAKIHGIEKEVQIISPYMKMWVFPPKQFIIYEMKKSMKNQEFPGSPEKKSERENEDGPTAEEKEFIKQDEKFMNQIRELSEKYGGTMDVSIRFVDDENLVFNLYAQVNENDIIKLKPMLPEEAPQEDIRIEIEFQKIYDMIYMQEKEMREEKIESPPWDKKPQPMEGIKNVVDGIKIYFQIRDIINSAEIYPKASEKEVRKLMKSFFSMIIKSEINRPQEKEDIEKEKGVWEEKEKITGESII